MLNYPTDGKVRYFRFEVATRPVAVENCTVTDLERRKKFIHAMNVESLFEGFNWNSIFTLEMRYMK